MAVGGARGSWLSSASSPPCCSGFGVGELLRPEESWMLHAFLGAMLAATSVGITARVLKDADALRAPFARIILGAAVIDDVLGLLVLAVVSGIITAAATGDAPSPPLPWPGSWPRRSCSWSERWSSDRSLRRVCSAGRSRCRAAAVVLALSLGFCFLLSYLALRAGLAPIVGAFAAGLVLEDVHFEGHVQRGEPPLHESLEPLTALAGPRVLRPDGHARGPPVLRVGVGARLRRLADRWPRSSGSSPAALAAPKGVSGLTLGLGMMPRGEVGLIFAGHRCAAGSGRAARRRRGHLRGRRVHGRGHHDVHAAAAAVVPQALRLRPARDPPGRRTGGRGRSPGSTRRPRPAGRRPR